MACFDISSGRVPDGSGARGETARAASVVAPPASNDRVTAAARPRVGAGVVVDAEPVRRQRRPRHQRPLVRPLDETRVVDRRGRRTAEPGRHPRYCGRPRGRQACARVREDRAAVEAIRWPSRHRQQVRALRRLPDACPRRCGRRREPHPRQIERRQPRDALLRRQARHAPRVHHHDAGSEPEQEQDAHRYPDVAVHPDRAAVEDAVQYGKPSAFCQFRSALKPYTVLRSVT